MPEGPEVKTVARTLKEHLIGKEFGELWHSAYHLRKPVDYEKIRRYENSLITEVSCYGKMLFIDVRAPALLIQLGMTGQLKVLAQSDAVQAHTHIRWPLKNTSFELRYVDPRRFGLFDFCDEQKKQALLASLGPDPFEMRANDHKNIIIAIRNSSRVIKDILLDQAVLVGVGNIYASEALFLASIHPCKRGCELSVASCERLLLAVREVLELAYENSGTTFSNYVDGSGKKGDNLAFLKVFQRETKACMRCDRPISRIKQSGRSTFFCSHCQPS